MYFEKYQDKAKEWRWTLFSSNGNKIADSGEGYKNETGCDHGISLVQSTTASTPVRKRR
jgi:uncharacterized protein YegP (UPF0339 family)